LVRGDRRRHATGSQLKESAICHQAACRLRWRARRDGHIDAIPRTPVKIPVHTGRLAPVSAALMAQIATFRMWKGSRGQRSRHAFEEAPDQIANSVLSGEIRALPARGGSPDMSDHRGRDLDAAVPRKTQSKRKVDVFHVAEVSFVKAPCRPKRIGADEAGSGAGCEYFALRRQFRDRPAAAAAPRNTGCEIVIACPIEPERVRGVDLRRAEHEHIGVPPRCRQQLLEPIRGREGIRIEKGEPFPARPCGAKVARSGEAKVAVRVDKNESFIARRSRLRVRKGAVVRTIVDENGLEILKLLRRNRQHGICEMIAGVVVDDDDADDGVVQQSGFPSVS